MRSGVMAAMAAVLVVAGCGTLRESRINPANWGGSQSAPVERKVDTPRDTRLSVAQVSDLAVETTNSGAIIRATGLPPTQGWYKAKLVEEPSERADELRFRFVIEAPQAGTRVGQPMSREVVVASFVNDFKLQGISTITVIGDENSRSTRRY